MKTIVTLTSMDVKKRCENCLQYVQIYITCFKCDAAYHIYCWKKVPGAYLTKRGQLLCCSSLTSNYATTDIHLGTQDNPPEGVIEKREVDGYNKDLENCPIKQEDSQLNEFKCDACHLEFTNQEHLENHYSECFNKEGGFKQELKEDKDLENCLHKEEDLEWSEFRCGTCLLEFANKEHLINHYNECPNEEREFIQELKGDKAGLLCSFYNEEHFQTESYEQHIKQCHVDSCSGLNENNSTYITNTKRNSARVDDKGGKCKRTLCNYSTHVKECVVKRIRTHNSERSFKCNVCGYAATQKQALKRHILVKHSNVDKKYKCKDCEYSAHTKWVLVTHIGTHTNKKPFKCKMCDYAAAQKQHLKRHFLTKHTNADKEYICKDCEFSTHTKGNLVTHMRTHTNEKPFQCDMCDYAAVQKQHLKKHFLTKHSNADKGYKCRDCKYSTHRKRGLAEHIRTHTTKKRFKCDTCDYASVREQHLKRHFLAKHLSADKEYKCKDCELGSSETRIHSYQRKII